MAQPAPARPKINTKPTQAWNASRPGVSRRPARGSARVRGEARESARGRAVIDLDAGITVYPPQENGGRWRAVWMEDGRRRYCEAVTEAKLAARLAKITERLEADAPSMERSGADLIAWYLSPDRLPPTSSGPASTPTLSGGCASDSCPRSSAAWLARTSGSPTCSESSTPPRRHRKAAGSMPWSRRWSGLVSAADTWPAPG
jgi:hypothetical protein